MANPSLQIGNGKWAIKEDSLLGYTELGNNIAPVEIDMTRATAGTRVNPQGLVETVELLGSELVTNGDFDNGATDWTITAGATITDVATISTTGSMVYISSDTANLVNGKSYKITLTATRLTGTGLLAFTDNLGNNITGTPLLDSDGELTYYFTAQADITGFGFKRHNSGTYSWELDNISVKESTKNNLARVDYTGSTSSLLAEPQRTNLVTYSEVYGAGTFFSSTVGSTIDNTTSTSPSGDSNATQITSTGQGKIQSGALSLTQNTDYVLSFYAKNVDATLVSSRVLATGGSGGSNLTSVNYQSEISTTEWTRITHIFNTGTNTTCFVYLSSNLNIGGTLQLWGAQLEVGSYATSYIPTSGSTVTRNQDTFTKTGISDKIGSEGVLFYDIAALSNDLTNRVISLNDGTASNRMMLYFNSASNTIAVAGTGYSISYILPDETSFNKVAVRYKENDITLWVNGQKRGVDIISVVIPTFTALKFDSGSGNSSFYGKIKALKLYKTYLTDSELITLTS